MIFRGHKINEKKVMSKFLNFAFFILEKNFRSKFFYKKKKSITRIELAKLLIYNSSPLFNLIYFLYSISLIFSSLLPNPISKKIIKKVYSPNFNPITKTFLFYLYHNDY